MGGKGRRRREKNFLAAHGGNSHLPPAPKPGDVDALPSKLRKLLKFGYFSILSIGWSDRRHLKPEKKTNTKDTRLSIAADLKKGGANGNTTVDEYKKAKLETDDANIVKKRKAKRKRDLELLTLTEDLASACMNRRDRKKRYLDARKKKNKKAKTDDIPEFPQHEKIKFGEVVEAPPKLVIPKALNTARNASHERLRLHKIDANKQHKGRAAMPGIPHPVTGAPSAPGAMKTPQKASQERLRLQAIAAYRQRRGLPLRPGIQLPPVSETLSTPPILKRVQRPVWVLWDEISIQVTSSILQKKISSYLLESHSREIAAKDVGNLLK
ncbi:hypothetical protein QJS04_geneDACA020647 [Acorus gramineus]|uniref:Uncharacterized protein n=1 Tax=Acorus gramineus TaxID=55184 RepID=A0AAV9BD38_ACOGR|nr:hypothetical protein QJS04_geneDACA020647 [Acorus gramineus]